MNVLILNQAFHPDVVSTAQHASDLASGLTQAGHEVTVICSSRGYDDPKLRFPDQETWNSVKIFRVRSTGLGKSSKWRRAADFSTFMVSCALRLQLLSQFDVVVAMTSPPLISFVAALAIPRKARRLLFWSMDLNPDEAIAAGWLRQTSLIARLLSRILVHSLQRADSIVALDRFMKERIEAKGIDARKILVVPPWAHDDHVKFDLTGREEFRRHHKLSNKFVIMYSGNHSPCHPLDTLLKAADRLANHNEIAFCFIGGGSEFQKVQKLALDRGLRNVLCLPYQPIEKLSGTLSAADLQIVVMGDKYPGIVHPCKIYNALAAQRVLLYIGPAESHIVDIINRGGIEAFVCSHGDVDGVVTNILRALRDRKLATSQDVEQRKRFSKELLVPRMISAIEDLDPALEGNFVYGRGSHCG